MHRQARRIALLKRVLVTHPIGEPDRPDKMSGTRSGHVAVVMDEVNAAVRDHTPVGPLPAAAERQPNGALHYTLQNGRGGGVVRHERMGQARVALPLAQQRQLGLEQRARPREDAHLQGGLVVVREVAADAEAVKQWYLEVVL